MIEEIKKVIQAFDAAVGEVNKLMDANVATDEDSLKVYEALDFAEVVAKGSLDRLKRAADVIRRERDISFRLGERFFVYKTEEYGQPRELCLHSITEAAGSSWHDLSFAVGHWARMMEMSANTKKKYPRRNPSKFGVAAYDPATGKFRKIEGKVLDDAFAAYKKANPWSTVKAPPDEELVAEEKKP